MTPELGVVTIVRTTTGTLLPKRHKITPTQRTETEAATTESSTVRTVPLKAHTTNIPFSSRSINHLLHITIKINTIKLGWTFHFHTLVFILELWSKVERVMCPNYKRHDVKITTAMKCSELCIKWGGCEFGFAFSSYYAGGKGSSYCDFCRDNQTKLFTKCDVYRLIGNIHV